MRLKTTFLCGLDQISLPTMPQRGERFADDYYITTDKGRIAELIREFGDALGSVETSYLFHHANAVVYRRGEIEVGVEGIEASLEKRAIDDMLALKRLEMGLWLVKDNAAHFDRVWLAARTSRGPVTHSNSWAARMSSADGTFEQVTFSSEELRLARSFKTSLPTYLRASDSPTMLAKGSLRFQRFLYFLGAARESTDVAMKIAQYCSGLEALVSTSQQELSHQVSERVSALLAPPGPDRISKFKLVKQAYGYRSKAVHGSSFSHADVNQLRDCSKAIDQIYRVLFSLYFQNNGRFRASLEGTDENVTHFFIELLLGIPAATGEAREEGNAAEAI
jgi:hypothetical protein